MWSCSRRWLLVGLTALPACGFQPAFGPAGPARELLEQVTVAAPTDKNAFDLVERLEERLGRTRRPLYRLNYAITTNVRGLAITPEDTTTRFSIFGKVRYELLREDTGAAVASGEVENFTSYNASRSTVTTASAREDALMRLMRLLADGVVTELVATSGQWSAQ